MWFDVQKNQYDKLGFDLNTQVTLKNRLEASQFCQKQKIPSMIQKVKETEKKKSATEIQSYPTKAIHFF